jgi:hypothetical protein
MVLDLSGLEPPLPDRPITTRSQGVSIKQFLRSVAEELSRPGAPCEAFYSPWGGSIWGWKVCRVGVSSKPRPGDGRTIIER